VSSTEELFESLPTEDGYTRLLGVPMDLVEQLRALYTAALDGEISLDTWEERHAQAVAGLGSVVDAGDLKRLEAQVNVVAKSVTEDFDRFVFLSKLGANLRLLQAPNPDRELREMQEALPTLTGEDPRSTVERRLATLQAMTGRTPSNAYEPSARMLKALQVGTLEETYRWLRAAVAEAPATSVQDLLTRAAVEVAEAKLELDRYDNLKAGPDEPRAQ
jgi:hypothetical protein